VRRREALVSGLPGGMIESGCCLRGSLAVSGTRLSFRLPCRRPSLAFLAGPRDWFLLLGIRGLSRILTALHVVDLLWRPHLLAAIRRVACSAAVLGLMALSEEARPGRIWFRYQFGVACIVVRRFPRLHTNRRRHPWRPSHRERWFSQRRGINGRVERSIGGIGRPSHSASLSSILVPSRVLSLDAPGLRSIARVSGALGLTSSTRRSGVPQLAGAPDLGGAPQISQATGLGAKLMCGSPCAHGLSSVPGDCRILRPRRPLGCVGSDCARRGSGAIHRPPRTSRASAISESLRSRGPHSTRRLVDAGRSGLCGALSSRRAWRVVPIRIEVVGGSCRPLHLSDGIPGRFFAWSFGAQLLGQRPIVRSGSRFSRARFCREPPSLGSGIVRRSGCRRARLPMLRVRLCR
jgi:hypothetical protein